jgi:hypothetical protein
MDCRPREAAEQVNYRNILTPPVTSPEKKKEGGTIMPEELVRVLIRLTSEQHEWLRKYCFDNRISQAEVLRQALELYRQELAKKERKG